MSIESGVHGRLPTDHAESSKRSGPGNGNVIDPTANSVMYNEFLKMMQANSFHMDNPLYSEVNFAGITIASNVDAIVSHFDKTCWIIDTGATDHMTSNLKLFASYKLLQNPVKVSLPDGTIKVVFYILAVYV